jgi:uncharacterized protein involved in response to NO
MRWFVRSVVRGAGWLAPPKWLWLTVWHAHEMIFGFCAAAIAGFH